MNKALKNTVEKILKINTVSNQRKTILQPLVAYIQEKVNRKEAINLNFICTHNSRRSHLAQIWSQFAAAYYNISNVNVIQRI